MQADQINSKKRIEHFYSLDALRGLAALAVVFWHWRHFSYRRAELTNFFWEEQPFFSVFKLVYLNGYRAVDLFFCLSGFIFFWLYSEKVRQHVTTAKEFAVLRFSRLYPLHFATLLIVAAGQLLFQWHYHTFLVYPDNDWLHFVSQLCFASCWEPGGGSSFNGMTWSISSEVLCYSIFFALCFLNRGRWWELILFTVAGYWIERAGYSNIGRGLFSFFIGGMAYKLFTYLLSRNLSRIWLLFLAGMTAFLWLFVPLNAEHFYVTRAYDHLHLAKFFTIHGRDVVGLALLKLCTWDFELLLFPITIITLALWEIRRGTLGKRVAFLGHISYSSYLIHFPIQMVFIAFAISYGVRDTFFRTRLSFVLFFAILIPLSLLTYRYFERPCQSAIRRRLLPRQKPADSPQIQPAK